MVKEFYFYADAQRPQRGHQSNHVVTVVIQRLPQVFLDTLSPSQFPDAQCSYRVGVAVKHQKDKLPFTKKEGREVAHKNMSPLALHSVDEVLHEVLVKVLRLTKNPNTLGLLDLSRLQSRIQAVLVRYDRRAKGEI